MSLSGLLTKPRRGASSTQAEAGAGFMDMAILLGIAAILVLARIGLAVVPTQLALAAQQQYIPWSMLPVTILLGLLGWWLAPRIGIPPIWIGPRGLRWRIVVPALIGLAVGSFWVLVDLLKPVSSATHATFPGIIFLYTYSAIFVETLTRLFFPTLVVWLIAIVVLRGRGVRETYWSVAIVLSLLGASEQAYATYQASGGQPAVLDVAGSFLLAAIFDPVAFWLYRRAGFLAPLVMHWVFYVVWHMVWGGLVQQVLLATPR